ncbi:MAG: DUF3987 domain-containing protein [Nitrospira sp. CR2.1]|nr:DUF3987 domain-containing protein [Nitrospira sp. CR2.1]
MENSAGLSGNTGEKLAPSTGLAQAEEKGVVSPSPFPIHALPIKAQGYVRESAQSLSVPSEMVALPALIVLATSIGSTRLIRLKADWTEPPILWGAIVATSGSMKSPALNIAVKPLQKLDSPTTRTWTSDVTIERLAGLLQQHPRGLLLVRDELVAWAKSMNQYRGGRGADRQSYLSIYGASSIRIDRKGNEKEAVSILVPRPHLSVVGCIPPSVLPALEDEGGREDGFLARLLFAWPAPVPVRWTDSVVSPIFRQEYEGLVQELFSISQDNTPIELCLSHDAQQRFITWHDALCEEIESDTCPTFLKASYSKLKGYCARFALVHAAASDPHTHEVGLASIEAACELVAYFKVQAAKVAPLLAPVESSKLESCKAEVRRKLSVCRLPKRILQKNSAYNAEMFNKAWEQLTTPEVLEVVKGEYGLSPRHTDATGICSGMRKP